MPYAPQGVTAFDDDDDDNDDLLYSCFQDPEDGEMCGRNKSMITI
jgi:hypothetical protein